MHPSEATKLESPRAWNKPVTLQRAPESGSLAFEEHHLPYKKDRLGTKGSVQTKIGLRFFKRINLSLYKTLFLSFYRSNVKYINI